MKRYINDNILHFCKAGIAAMIFCIGVLPVSAQDDDADVAEEAPAEKKAKKPIKQYPMKCRVR